MSGVKTYDWPKKLRLGPPVKSQNDGGRYKKVYSMVKN